MRKELGALLAIGGVAGMAILAMGVITIHFPEGTVFYKPVERTYGVDPSISKNVVTIPDNSTAMICAQIGNKRYKVRAQDGNAKGGVNAVVDVIGVGSVRFVKKGKKTSKEVPGMEIEYSGR